MISRANGRSAVSAAAYRHATVMKGSGGKTKDYSKKIAELVYSEIGLPANAPDWARKKFGKEAFEKALKEVRAAAARDGEELSDDRAVFLAWAKVSEALWNSVEAHEMRVNRRYATAQFARTLTISLPKELSFAAQVELMQTYVREVFCSSGMIADWVLHDKEDGNPHAHIMLTLRNLEEDGWGLKNRSWNAKSTCDYWRKAWAEHANLMLEREGFAERIDHRSLRDQELNLEPENYDPYVAEHAEHAEQKPREKLRCEEVRRRNQAYLRAHPDHILAVVQMSRSVFSEGDVRNAFAKRLGLEIAERGGELDRLTNEVMASPDLLPVVDGRSGRQAESERTRFYITMAKARMAQDLAQDARELAEGKLALSAEVDQAAVGGDAIDVGTGPIVFDLADWKVAESDAGRGKSAADRAGENDPAMAAERKRFAAAKPRARASESVSVAVVKEALSYRAEDLFRMVFGEPLRTGAPEWQAREKTSKVMRMRGPKRGLWHDFSAAEGGDLLDLVAREFLGLSSAKANFPKVLKEAARYCGIATDQPVDTRALEARAADREWQAQEAERREEVRRAALVKDLAGRAVPVNGIAGGSERETPASLYLASRGITELPESGLDYLPPVPGVPVAGSGHAALVVWAVDETGTITGGQRILVAPDGSKAPIDVRKPSFGAIGGSAARFPARGSSGSEGAPLVIAEGPESALSIWQTTGHETWAVFGVSGWERASIPVDRPVILAPDRDAPDSPAGRAFRKAVAHHLARGCDLRIATAPEPVGSKRDLNDTLMRADGGPDAVRAAITEARSVQAYLSPDLNAGQLAAAKAMLSSDRLTLVTGHAGVGKTFTIREAARAWQARGVHVLAGAPSGKATQELAGIPGVEAATLAAWESRWARGELGSLGDADKFVFFMDEAGMVGLGQWSRLQARIEAMGGKLIAVGDPEQLQPVKDMSGWAVAERHVLASGGTVPVIDLVIRQRSKKDRTATENLARADDAGIRAGLAHYAQSGALRLDAAGSGDPVEEIARAYFFTDAPLAAGDSSGPGRALAHYNSAPGRIALAYTNSDVEALNAAIRDEAVRRGLLNKSETQVFTVERIERQVEGNELQSVRKRVEIEIAAGDRIMLTRAHEALDLPRSGFGTVVAVANNEIDVLMDGREDVVRIDTRDFAHFDYGYAATVHKSQGMTEQQVLVLPHRMMGRHATNVALTRHVESVTVFGRAGHCESVKDFYKLGLRRDVAHKIPDTARQPGTMVPLPGDAAILMRSDWAGPAEDVSGRHSFLSDPHLMGVATRVAGLLSADHTDSDPLLDPDREDLNGYTQNPQQVIVDLLRRQSVVRADEVASVLAREVSDPETFQRLFSEAMSLPGLVALPTGEASQTSDPWVYTTEAHLKAELTAVDRGMQLAATRTRNDRRSAEEPISFPSDLPDLTSEQRGAVAYSLAPGGLKIVRGETGSGKTRVAAAVARAQKESGCVVTVISPTQTGCRALQEEGVESVTLSEFFSQPVLKSGAKDPQRVVILDDAHGLGIGRADVFLARVEMMGAKLVATVNPARRPAEAGPVFETLAGRIETAHLSDLHGVENDELRSLAHGLRAADQQSCSEALQQARADGVIHAAGSKDKAISTLARRYVADRAVDKLAVGWGRVDAEALTRAIRARLDEVDGDRRAFRTADSGPLAGLKPKDRIRFTSAGMFGEPARGAVSADGRPGSQRARIRRGDIAEVLGPAQHGGLVLRVTGDQGVREITVAPEGPLPRWQFAFASTIMAAAGRRHESIHLLGSTGLDRETLTAGALSARERLDVVMPVEEAGLDTALGRIAGRERLPQSGLDHGFDPALAGVAAREAHRPGLPGTQVPASAMDADVASGLTPAELTRLTKVPQVSLSATRLKTANEDFLKANPDHILAIVQTDKPVFTEHDVLRGLRNRLGHMAGEEEIRALGAKALASDELIQLDSRAPDGSWQYVTQARAAMMRQCEADAGKLASGVFEVGRGSVVKPDALVDLNPPQRAAAEAMLAPERITLVTGHAGVGKTYTLGKVAKGWKARGVTVLAGASSGRARDELAASLKGVETRTLAAWEAAWTRGEKPPQGEFVFIMDEAGMVGVGQWSRIQRQVASMGGKLIAVGDPEQLQPVADLPGWAVAERAVGRTEVVDTVLRQDDPMDREATEALARGADGVATALHYYAEKGAVRLEPEIQADPVGAIARNYWKGPVNHSRIAVAATRRDVAQLNDAIRFEALTAGIIKPASVQHYDRITRVFSGVEGGQDRVSVRLDLGVGERIILTAAHAGSGMPRSSFGTVTATREREIDVAFDGHADPVTLDLGTFRGLDYGYAATVHKAQGLGADRVHVLPHRHMNRHAVYVAMSRHKARLMVYGRSGHAESTNDLIRMGQAAGHLDAGTDDIPAGAETPAAGLVPGADIVGLGLRADWQAQGADLTRTGFVGDAELMAVAERRVGLLSTAYRKGDPVLNPDVEDRRGYARLPRRVVDDLVARQSVFRAEDVESQLGRIVKDPETFLRLYRAAMTHPDLVMLSDGGAQNAGRVYTTREQLRLEVETVDLGARLALASAPDRAPKVSFSDLLAQNPELKARLAQEMPQEQRDVLHHALAPGQLRLIRGEAGSGKITVAAETARLHEQAGWQVLSVTATGAGMEALERAGAAQPRSYSRFMDETKNATGSGDEDKKSRVQLDAETVVVLSHANRLGAREMRGILDRVEASGAKLVAFLGGEEEAPIEAGAVMRALEMRVGAAWLGADRSRDPASTMVVSGLVRGGKQADKALEQLRESGALVSGGNPRRAIEELATSYVDDQNPDKIALTWGRADAQAVTAAIRARLDKTDPARAGIDADAALKSGDRVRFLQSTRWVPPTERGKDWENKRIRAGERAEVIGVDPETSNPVLRITERGGKKTRDLALTPDVAAALPKWDYAFAGTIHGEAALVRENVHLLVSPGMSRQVLAAGAAAHRGDLRLVVPSSKKRMGKMLTRIVQREDRAETVLDYGFDASFGAREAMRGHSVEVVGDDKKGLGLGIDRAIDRLARMAGIERAAPVPVAGQGLEGEVLAEVIGAAILRDGQAPEGKDRLAVERFVRALSDGREWRQIQRQVPTDLSARADDLARDVAGEDGQGQLLGTARVLARGVLAARALGEDPVAGMFEAGLDLYGKRAEMARAHGKMDALLPERVDTAPARDLPNPAARPETAKQRWSRQHRPRGRGRGLLSEIMAGINASDEQVARMALEVWGIADRPKRRARTMAYAWEVKALRKQQAAAMPNREADHDVADRARNVDGAGRDYTGMAQYLTSLIAAQGDNQNVHQPADMDKRIASLLEQADKQVQRPWSRVKPASMETLAGRVLSLPDLKDADKALAEAVGRALRGDPVTPVAEAPARGEEVSQPSDDGLSVEQGQQVAPNVDTDTESVAPEQVQADSEQLSPSRPFAPSQIAAQGDIEQQAVPRTGDVGAEPGRVTMPPRPDQSVLALQIAVSLSKVLPADDPLHKRDLPHDLGMILVRSERGPGLKKDAPLQDRIIFAMGHPHTPEEHKPTIMAVSKSRLTFDDLPKYDGLIRERGTVLKALLAPDRPTFVSRDVIQRMEQVFTQSEIGALKDVSTSLPDSVTGLEAKERARVAEYLVPGAGDRRAGQIRGTEEEKGMDQRQTLAAREKILSALLLNDVSDTMRGDLRKVFGLEEIRALKDPALALPESLPELTQSERKEIARAIAANQPTPKGRGGASRFEPDPRYDGRALQLACAITERVTVADPVHKRNLVMDIRALLKEADAAARSLPADKVEEVTRNLTSARVALDVKMALAAKLDGEKFNVPLFLRNVGQRNPDPKRKHPLGFATRDAKETYDRDADRLVQRALSDNPEPTQAEVSVARIANLPNLPKGSAGLVEAMKYVFEEGSLSAVDDLLKERESLLTEIADTKERPRKSEGMLRRIFQTFTHREVFALATPDKSLPGTVPALDENRRIAVAQGLSKITKARCRTLSAFAWGPAAQSLENGLHPERARSRSRGMGM